MPGRRVDLAELIAAANGSGRELVRRGAVSELAVCATAPAVSLIGRRHPASLAPAHTQLPEAQVARNPSRRQPSHRGAISQGAINAPTVPPVIRVAQPAGGPAPRG